MHFAMPKTCSDGQQRLVPQLFLFLCKNIYARELIYGNSEGEQIFFRKVRSTVARAALSQCAIAKPVSHRRTTPEPLPSRPAGGKRKWCSASRVYNALGGGSLQCLHVHVLLRVCMLLLRILYVAPGRQSCGRRGRIRSCGWN